MLKFYYAHGSSSLASHIALEETGASYEGILIDFAGGEQRGEAYLDINPRGRVPALAIETGEILTENVAILYYLASRFPEAELLPSGLFNKAQAVSLAAFFASSVHVAHRHIRQPHQYTPDETAFAAIQDVGRKTFYGYLEEIDRLLQGKDWLLGRYTIADPYAFIFYWSGVRQKMPVRDLKAYTDHTQRILARPAAQRVLAADPAAGVLLQEFAA